MTSARASPICSGWWTPNALTLAAFVLTSGSLADRLGRRRVFAIGLMIFTGASALCALSGSPLLLNLARALQGVEVLLLGALIALIGAVLSWWLVRASDVRVEDLRAEGAAAGAA